MHTRRTVGALLLVTGVSYLALFLLSYVAAFRDGAAGEWFRGNFLAPGYGGFAVALLVAGAGLLRPVAPANDGPVTVGVSSEPPSEPLVRPVAIPPEAVELEEGTVAACLRCGSRNLRFLPLGGGFFPEVECLRCHHRGMPMQFDNTTGYRQFVIGLHEPAPDGFLPR